MTFAVALAAAFVPSVAAAEDNPPSGTLSNNVSLRVLLPTPGEIVTTPVLNIEVYAGGYKLDAGYSGTPKLRRIGHYHEILDGRLVDMTPLHDPNVDTVSMVGVTPGQHVLTLVPANNDHSMVMAAAVMIPFTYAGPNLPLPAPAYFSAQPTIAITSPANGTKVEGRSFFMTATWSNFVVCGECFGKDNVDGVGHWHIFVDQPAMANMLTMAGNNTQEVSLKGVSEGWHSFFAVLVNNQHMPFMGAMTTMTSVNVYVDE